MDIKVDSYTVIVFDLDDTLYNELDYLKSAFKSIAIHLEPSQWKQLYSTMFSLYRSGNNVFEVITKRYRIEVKTLIHMYQNHVPSIELFDGVREVLEAIKLKQGKIGIVTDGRSITQRAKIESLGISKYVDKIIISEEYGSEKPDVANFKAIENSLLGNEYYYIADNFKKDFIGPNSLGWKSIALIDNGKNIHCDTHKFMGLRNLPQHWIVDFQDLKII